MKFVLSLLSKYILKNNKIESIGININNLRKLVQIVLSPLQPMLLSFKPLRSHIQCLRSVKIHTSTVNLIYSENNQKLLLEKIVKSEMLILIVHALYLLVMMFLWHGE